MDPMSRTYPRNEAAGAVRNGNGRTAPVGVSANGNGAAALALRTPVATSRVAPAAKRALDIALAVVLLIALLPLLLVVAGLIKLDSRGPVFFKQRRLGRTMTPFTVLKFRTMEHGAAQDRHREFIAQLAQNGSANGSAALKKLTDDPRVTGVGRILRKLSIDELPQLINVLLGQMSLVGPRPALEYEIEHYEALHFDRFSVRPGLTGLWQVSGRNRLGFKEMLELDAEYARTATLFTDLRILARTPGAAIRHAA
jgi:lipopolysaccharide/colanic/teichoic acid biosynthesis glycosyltransferase